eukprot:scaffold264658_cov17-Tisochrysis_lutea.AAC.2
MGGGAQRSSPLPVGHRCAGNVLDLDAEIYNCKCIPWGLHMLDNYWERQRLGAEEGHRCVGLPEATSQNNTWMLPDQ